MGRHVGYSHSCMAVAVACFLFQDRIHPSKCQPCMHDIHDSIPSFLPSWSPPKVMGSLRLSSRLQVTAMTRSGKRNSFLGQRGIGLTDSGQLHCTTPNGRPVWPHFVPLGRQWVRPCPRLSDGSWVRPTRGRTPKPVRGGRE